jgi:hypothetical protein
MAGDWLKMDCSTPDKPEVLAITARMGWDDADLTVGKLFRVWRWFDQQTTDGNAVGVTSALLDRIAGVSGFAQAMQSVGWLVVSDAGLELPNFEKHNGATAKSRAQTAKRVANHRASDESNADSNGARVTSALAREEKRREEKEEKSAPAARGPVWAAPEWMPSTQWAAFVAMRKAKGKRAPFTDEARDGIVSDLAKFRAAGHDIAEVLQSSVNNGWSGVFAPKAAPSKPKGELSELFARGAA